MDTIPTKTHASVSGGGLLRKYADVIVGSRSPWRVMYFEWCGLFAGMSGAVGMALRKVFWPRLFASCGKGVKFGQGMILRQPHRIKLGNRVVFGEGCVLDARSPGEATAIEIGDDGMLSVGVMLSCKGGRILLGDNIGVGPRVTIQSMGGEPVTIGRDCIIGAGCYFAGGGNYNTERVDVPIRLQGKRTMGGSRLEDDCWIGANCTVLGGVTVGRGSVIGAGAVVVRDLPSFSVSVGVPARVIRRRGPTLAGASA
jgi:acetyltransferase-like isoleucine patch superfamily enzyme